jgi:hypothetical protein
VTLSKTTRKRRRRRFISNRLIISALAPCPTTEDDHPLEDHRSMNLISDFYMCYYYCCSCTRELLCYFDKMCSVCLSYYLLSSFHVDDDDKRGVGTLELVELRNGRREHGGWHGCKSRQSDDRLDGDGLRTVLHN